MERFLDHFIPESYDLSLTFDKPARLIHGVALILGQPRDACLKFHALDMSFSRIKVDGKTLTKKQWSYDGKTLVILRPGAEIQINFTSKISSTMLGCYASTYQHKGKEELIITTQFESHYAQKAFPCIDEPAAKATFTLNITTDLDDIILSNMPIREVSQDTTYFETTPRMSTYLLAWIIGKFNKYETTSAHGVKIASYAALNQPVDLLKYPTEVAARSLDYYDDLFDTPYPLPKLDQVALPDFDSGAMENWGLVTYRESLMLADVNSSVDTIHSVALTIAHELAHQWFGNLVTMQWWDDLWLNESFASLLEYFAVDQLYPEYQIWDNFYLSSVLISLRRDTLPGVQAVKQDVHEPSEISTLFDGAIVYAKGARLLLMLIRLMGEQSFFTGTANYFKKYAHQNTVGDDLWDTLTDYADFEVREFMNAWISQPGFPVITNDEQTRFLLDSTTDDSRYPIQQARDDLSGHYIFNLSPKELSDTLAHFDTLSKEQKLRLLLDRMLLAKTNYVHSSSLLDLVATLASDQSYPVWDLISVILSDLKIFIDPDTPTEKHYKHFIRQLVMPHVNRLGVKAIPDEPQDDTLLRPIVLCFATYSDDKQTLRQLHNIYLSTPVNQIDPNIRSIILSCEIKYFETPELIDSFIEAYRRATDPDLKSDLLLALSSSVNQATLSDLLELIKDRNTIRPQSADHAFIYILRNRHGTDLAIKWMIKNWDFIVQNTGDQGLDTYPTVLGNTLRTEKQQKTFLKHFSPLKNDPALARSIEVATTQIASRLSLITSDGPEVATKLAKITKDYRK